MEDISVKMRHAALKKLYNLAGELAGADGGKCVTIPETYWPAKMGRRYWKPGHPVGDIAVIELPHDAPSWAPRASIPYIWIFEGASEE